MTIMQVEAPVLVESDDGRVLTEQEQTWAQFLRDLEPWELHKLHTHGQELKYHDKFIDGKMSLIDIFAKICIEGEEEKHSIKV